MGLPARCSLAASTPRVCKHSANARGDSGRRLASLCGIRPGILKLAAVLCGTLRHSTMSLPPPLHGGGQGFESPAVHRRFTLLCTHFAILAASRDGLRSPLGKQAAYTRGDRWRHPATLDGSRRRWTLRAEVTGRVPPHRPVACAWIWSPCASPPHASGTTDPTSLAGAWLDVSDPGGCAEDWVAGAHRSTKKPRRASTGGGAFCCHQSTRKAAEARRASARCSSLGLRLGSRPTSGSGDIRDWCDARPVAICGDAKSARWTNVLRRRVTPGPMPVSE